jgi:hypothetical protein
VFAYRNFLQVPRRLCVVQLASGKERDVTTTNIERGAEFHNVLAADGRSPQIPESCDVYGWLCGSWDLVVLRYRGVDVSAQGLTGEVHAARVLEGGAVQDVWIMPPRSRRQKTSDPTMNMYGTTLRSWDASIQAWRIAWTNPIRSHREEQIGAWNGRDILQTGARADGTKTRWTFTEITADSFHWRGEALYPNATDWVLEGEFLATRRRS